MNAANTEVHARDVAANETLYGFADLAMCNAGEVLFFTTYGNDWSYGILRGQGAMMSVYRQLSDSGVDSNVYVTSPRIRDTFCFRIARPEEYRNLMFSYDYRPGPLH